MTPQTVFWFRRDLRLDDNHGLTLARAEGLPVLPIFILDECILRSLPKGDKRLEFIRKHLAELKIDNFKIFEGEPLKVWPRILKDFNVRHVFTNEDYEPYAIERDAKVAELVRKVGGEFHSVKDQVIFAKNEVVKDNGEPYRVF